MRAFNYLKPSAIIIIRDMLLRTAMSLYRLDVSRIEIRYLVGNLNPKKWYILANQALDFYDEKKADSNVTIGYQKHAPKRHGLSCHERMCHNERSNGHFP